MPRFDLGDRIKDTVTGIEGVAVARAEYLNGCTQYCIQQPADKDGKIPESYYIDHTQLVLVKAGAIKVKSADTGGAMRSVPPSTRP